MKNVNKEILRLAIPSMLANMTIPLVGLVDTTIIGHISYAAAIGGIAIGTMLFDLIYWNFGFLRAGTSGLTAQAYGANKLEKCVQYLFQSVFIALMATILIWSLQWILIKFTFYFIPCSEEVANFAHAYFFVRIWAAPATLSLMAIKGWLIGMQDTFSSMIVDIVINFVNIIVSFVLSVYTPVGILGVAYCTVFAQYSGLITALFIFVIKYKNLFSFVIIKNFFCELRTIKSIFSLNANLYVRSLGLISIYVGFTSLASRYGNEQLAVSSIVMKLFMLYSHFVDGFAFAGQALVGKFIGSKEYDRMSLSIKMIFLWASAVGIFFSILYAILGTNFIGLITSDRAVITRSIDYLIWLALMPFLSVYAFMWDGIYIGATAGRQIRDAMLLAVFAFIATYIGLASYIGIQALYLAYNMHLVARSIYLTIKWKPLKISILTNK